MKYTENMTFEEASKALIDELNANLATLHQNYHVEQSAPKGGLTLVMASCIF